MCEDGSDYGIDPENYETEEEYDAALEKAEQEQAEEDEDDSDIQDYASVEDMPEPKESDYPNRRTYDAADWLVFMRKNPSLYTEEAKQRRSICNFILEGKVVAARYLTVERGFLFVQAAKEHFDLPCTFPDEDEAPKTDLEALIKRVSRRSSRLAIEVWAWCIEEFSPYLSFSPYEGVLYNDVLMEIYDFADSFKPELIRYFEKNENFAITLYKENPKVPRDADVIVNFALQQGKIAVAKTVFRAFLQNKKVVTADIEEMVDSCIEGCENWNELEAMEAFRDNLYPLVKQITDREITSLFPEWDKLIQEYIDEVECTSEKYAYSRRYAWRSKYRKEKSLSIDPLDYEDEQEFLEDVEEEKYGWRDLYSDEAEEYDISLEDFETERDFLAEFDRRRIEKEKKRVKQARKPENKRSQKEYMDPLAQTDQTIYGFCSVVFESSSQAYSYRTGSLEVNIGDKVVVPVGKEKKEVVATVVSVGKYLRMSAPYPVDKANTIIRKLE